MAVLFAAACSDEVVLVQPEGENPLNLDKGIGELVLFSTGNAGNTTTRAEVCPYMELDGRFVCKMYYHAKATDTDASPFDTISTPITSWLRVNNNEGNSVYWRNDYDMAGVDKTHQDYVDYGFDSRAQYFYWRNRLDHIFLGYCDYNQLKTNSYRATTNNGKTTVEPHSLFMYPEYDGAKKTKTGELVSWAPVSYRTLSFGMVSKPNPAYNQLDKDASDAAIAAWETAKSEWEADSEHEGFPFTVPKPDAYTIPETIDALALTGVKTSSTFPSYYGGFFPLSTKSSYYTAITQDQINATQTKLAQLVDEAGFLTADEKTALKTDLSRINDSEDEQTAEGTFHNERWYVTFDPDADDAFVDGALNFGADNITVYSTRSKKNIEDVIATAPANTFDMTRGTKTTMSEQPDPLIALTKMKPMGATQEANRVRLHFKHQFSQIQVNLVNAENTAEITTDNIVSVELLGVTKKGYVFTTINPDGTQIPPSYDPVVISQYTEEQLKENPYGTSFNMFTMTDEEKPATSLKSFNAIAFGQLQAIRITWQEEETHEIYTEETAAEANAKYLIADANGKMPGDDGYTPTYKAGYTAVSAGDVVPPVKHVATYKITVDDRNNSLVNLRSGFRYMYDFELRRGTIAFIRATIDGWQLSDDLDFNTSGTINE